jgi:chromosome partitioning protein
VIDTPPAVTKAISEVVAFADLVVLPTRPSPHDLRAVGPTIDICEARRKPVVFVLNAAMARARITMEAAVALSQHGTVAPTTIHNRTDFAASMIDGRTVMEADPEGKSAEEIAALWDYLQLRLMRREISPEMLADGLPPVAMSRSINTLGRPAPAFGRRAAQG